MRILVLGLDNSILDKNSKLAKRAVEYGELVEKYRVIVPAKKNEEVVLSDKVKAHGVKAKNKICGLIKICALAKKLLKKEEYNIVSTQDQYYLGFVAYKLAKKFKKGMEIQVHGFERYSGLRKIIAKFILPRANAVRCVSQRLKRQLMDEFGVREDRITVVPIFSERITRNVERVTRNDGKFIFLTVGRLVPVKNIKMQIEVMAEISRKLKVESRRPELWIIGEGPEKEKLKTTSYKLQANVKFLGWQNNLVEFYSQADAFLLTSNSEGWGLAAIEAASFGLPIIMTDVGCAGEVIRDNESGMIIPVGDQKKLEEAMLKLIENLDLRKKLGDGALEAVKNLPSKQDILNLYKKSWELAKGNN